MSAQLDPALVTHPLDVARQAAYVGGASAIPGTVIGAFYGTLRTQTPVLFSIASGAQWFAIGTTFWGTRTCLLNQTGLLNWWNSTRGAPCHERHDLNPTSSDKIRASVMAGAFTGLNLGLLFRGPRNIIPGTIMFSLFGWAGQLGYNHLDAKNSSEIQQQADLRASGEDKPKESLMHKFAMSKWSPMSVLSDDEYENMMQEKLLKVEAEIAIIDDRIDGLRKKAAEIKARQDIEKSQLQEQNAK